MGHIDHYHSHISSEMRIPPTLGVGTIVMGHIVRYHFSEYCGMRIQNICANFITMGYIAHYHSHISSEMRIPPTLGVGTIAMGHIVRYHFSEYCGMRIQNNLGDSVLTVNQNTEQSWRFGSHYELTKIS